MSDKDLPENQAIKIGEKAKPHANIDPGMKTVLDNNYTQNDNQSVQAQRRATPSSSHDQSIDVGASPAAIPIQPTSLVAIGRLMQITEDAPPEILSSARTFRSEADAGDLELSLPQLSSNNDQEEEKQDDTRS